MKTQPTEITTTPTQRQRWRIEILITHQIMKLEPKGAGQQTTTPSMKMKDNGRGEIAQSKITLCESCQFSGIFQLLLVSLQHKCIYNCGLCGKKVVFESLLFFKSDHYIREIMGEKKQLKAMHK